MPCTLGCLPVKIEQVCEAGRLATYNGESKRQVEQASACDGLGCAAHRDPDRKLILVGPRIDPTIDDARCMPPAGPADPLALIEFHEKLQLLGEEAAIVAQVIAE